MQKLVIFLGGGQGSGKTSAAEYIEKVLFESGWFVNTVRFADPIKEIAQQMHAKLQDYTTSPQSKVLLQKLGDAGRDTYGDDIWIKAAYGKLQELAKQYDQVSKSEPSIKYCFIYEDVRKPKELELKKTYEQDGYTTLSFHFTASEDIRKLRLGENFRPNTGHSTESDLALFKANFDFDVNTEGLEDLKEKTIYKILQERSLLESPESHLESLVDQFNSGMANWQKLYDFGANFQWGYNQDGRKILKVKDAAPIQTLPEDMQMVRLAEVQKTMEGLDGSQQFRAK